MTSLSSCWNAFQTIRSRQLLTQTYPGTKSCTLRCFAEALLSSVLHPTLARIGSRLVSNGHGCYTHDTSRQARKFTSKPRP